MDRFNFPSNERGFTLVEITVATFLFSVVVLIVLLLYETGHQSTVKGERASDLQQNTRVGFDAMMDELRLAGFDYDRDGDRTEYADSPDEPLEFIHEHAISFRANLDHENAVGGRESALEIGMGDPGWGTDCCPIVTTANEEIVTYALRSDDPAANTDSITIKVDSSTPRDATIDGTGIQNEETLTIPNVDLSDDHPPYRLFRFVVNDAGDGFIETPVADDIRSLRFRYSDGSGSQAYCKDSTNVPCFLSDLEDYDTIGGSDDLDTAGDMLGRTARDQIRGIEIELVGMEAAPDGRYRDPATDATDPAEVATQHFRKFKLTSRISPPNLGRTGEPDLASKVPDPPTNVTICGGQCDTVRVEWDMPGNAKSYTVFLYDAATSPATLVHSADVVGTEVPDSSPPRAYAVFDANDSLDIAEGRSLYARVAAKNSKGADSEPSLASSTITLTDVTRPEAPPWMAASGYDPKDNDWPDTSVMSVYSNSSSFWYPKENKIAVVWDAPSWTLDVTDQADPAGSVTTLVDATTLAALDCDAAMADIDGDGVDDKLRTPLREVRGNERFLIFRSTDSRFVPTSDDLVAVVKGDYDPNTGKLYWMDETKHVWDGGNWVKSLGAVPCCKDLFYRIRSADACWSGSDPAAISDPHLSPFFPPLNPANPSDTDDTSAIAAGAVGLAVPGYAHPSGKPNAPTEVRYVDGRYQGSHFYFSLKFLAPKKDQAKGPLNAPRPQDATYAQYVVYAHPSDSAYTLSYNGSPTGEGKILGYIDISDFGAQMIYRDDENEDGTIQPWEDESLNASGQSTLEFKIADNVERFVRIAPLQCMEDFLAGDGSDYYAYDLGDSSEAIKVPCHFGGDQTSGAYIDSSNWPDSVSVYASTTEGTATFARLNVAMPATGETAMSDAPGIGPDFLGSNTFTFGSDEILELSSRMSPGMPVYVSAEVQDSNGCYTYTDKSLESIGIPSCCINFDDPAFSIDSRGREIYMTFNEKCNADPLTVHTVEFEVGNENGGRDEKLRKIYWGDELIWQGNQAVDTIDLSALPRAMGPQSQHSLFFETSADVTLDSLRVRLVYDVGEGAGDCVAEVQALQPAVQ